MIVEEEAADLQCDFWCNYGYKEMIRPLYLPINRESNWTWHQGISHICGSKYVLVLCREAMWLTLLSYSWVIYLECIYDDYHLKQMWFGWLEQQLLLYQQIPVEAQVWNVTVGGELILSATTEMCWWSSKSIMMARPSNNELCTQVLIVATQPRWLTEDDISYSVYMVKVMSIEMGITVLLRMCINKEEYLLYQA